MQAVRKLEAYYDGRAFVPKTPVKLRKDSSATLIVVSDSDDPRLKTDAIPVLGLDLSSYKFNRDEANAR
jgi:hypothetical protein